MPRCACASPVGLGHLASLPQPGLYKAVDDKVRRTLQRKVARPRGLPWDVHPCARPSWSVVFTKVQRFLWREAGPWGSLRGAVADLRCLAVLPGRAQLCWASLQGHRWGWLVVGRLGDKAVLQVKRTRTPAACSSEPPAFLILRRVPRSRSGGSWLFQPRRPCPLCPHPGLQRPSMRDVPVRQLGRGDRPRVHLGLATG